MKKELYRQIPKIDAFLENERVIDWINTRGKSFVMKGITEVLDQVRNRINKLEIDQTIDVSLNSNIEALEIWLKNKEQNKLRRVINATGIVVHTNLGRSSLAGQVQKDLMEVAMNYSTLEFDLKNGKRGSRYEHVEEIICELTGAEAAMVVNNNAAAVMLVLNTLARDKEVIVSRGQLVEIGGSFRIPEVMKLSGARLVEVGATNKTHIRDYEDHITDQTAMLLKVHTSNFKVLGFTKEVESVDLCELAHKYHIPVYDDLGSGMLIDLSAYGFKKEPTVQESVAAGIDVVTFSGDKMLGGPQAGIIVGKKKYIESMKKNQLTRALRVDKMTLAALESTLMLYRQESNALKNIPTLRMLTTTYEAIAEKASLFVAKLGIQSHMDIHLEDDYSQVGGGSMPLEKLRSKVMIIKHDHLSAQDMIEFFRHYEIPIIGRIKDESVLFDFRTITEEELEIIHRALLELNAI